MILLARERGPFPEGTGTFDCSNIYDTVGGMRTPKHWNQFRNGPQTAGITVCLYQDAPEGQTNIYGGTTARYYGMYPAMDIKFAYITIVRPQPVDPRSMNTNINVVVDLDGDGTNPTFTVDSPISASQELVLFGIMES